MDAMLKTYASAIVDGMEEAPSKEAAEGYLKRAVEMLAKRGFSKWELLIAEVEKTFAEKQGIRRVRVVVAEKLSEAERTKLTASLGGSVAWEEVVDPKLLAGIRIETESHVIDGSAKQALAQLHRALVAE